MQEIIDGFLKFQRDAFPQRSERFRQLATSQHPRTLFISYSDSRLVPELVTQHEAREHKSERDRVDSMVRSYGDTQRYRLGENFNHIPINAPQCFFRSYGAMRVDGNLGGTASYQPNSQGLCANPPDYSEPQLSLNDDSDHCDHRVDGRSLTQPGNLFGLIQMKSLKHLLIAVSMSAVAAANAQESVAPPVDASAPTVSQASTNAVARTEGRAKQDSGVEEKDQCVGPISFCNIYFGS